MILISNRYGFMNYKNIFEYKIVMLLLTALILIKNSSKNIFSVYNSHTVKSFINKSIENHLRYNF